MSTTAAASTSLVSSAHHATLAAMVHADARPETIAQAHHALQVLLSRLLECAACKSDRLTTSSSIDAPRDDNNDSEQLFRDAYDALTHWLRPTTPARHSSTAKVHTQRAKPLPLALWLMCLEVGSALLLAQAHTRWHQQQQQYKHINGSADTATPSTATVNLPAARTCTTADASSHASDHRVLSLLTATHVPLLPLPQRQPFAASYSTTTQQQQSIAFSCSVWDALVGSALSLALPTQLTTSSSSSDALAARMASSTVAPTDEQERARVLQLLLVAFTHVVSAAMRGTEVAFVAHASAALVAHIRQQMQEQQQQQAQTGDWTLSSSSSWHAAHTAALTQLQEAAAAAALQWHSSAPSTAVAVLVLEALMPTTQDDERLMQENEALRATPQTLSTASERVITQLQQRVASSLACDPLPRVDDPNCIVGVALGWSALRQTRQQDAGNGNDNGAAMASSAIATAASVLSTSLSSSSAVLVQLLALLRIANLPLSRMGGVGDTDSVDISTGISATTAATTQHSVQSIQSTQSTQQYEQERHEQASAATTHLTTAAAAASQTLARRLTHALSHHYRSSSEETIISSSSSGDNKTMAMLALCMIEASVNDATSHFRHSPAAYTTLLHALQTVYAPGVLSDDALLGLGSGNGDSDSWTVDSDDVTTTTNDARAIDATLLYLRTLYAIVSTLLQALTATANTSAATVSATFTTFTTANVSTVTATATRAFVVLAQLEFARESCASAETNALMHALTQQLEDAIEQHASDAHFVLPTLLQSVSGVVASSVPATAPSDPNAAWSAAVSATPPAASSNSQDAAGGARGASATSSAAAAVQAIVAAAARATRATARSVVPIDADVLYAAHALAVGVLVQRKLRLVLFRSPPALVDDALALAFRGAWSAFVPLQTFAQSFLSFCLTHLGAYVSIYRIAPFYLLLALAKFPQSHAARTSLASTLGVVFGALFYASDAATASPVADPVAAAGSASTATTFTRTGSSSSATTATTTTVNSDDLSPQQRVVVWAVQMSCARIAELVLAPSVSPDAALPPSASSTDSSDPSLQTQRQFVASTEPPQSSLRASGLFLAGVVFEVMKLSPLELLAPIAMEIERLLSTCAEQATMTISTDAASGDQAETRDETATKLHAHAQGTNTDASGAALSSSPSVVVSALLSQLFTSISQHCEASRRAWLAAWYVELAQLYGTSAVEASDEVAVSSKSNSESSNETTSEVVSRL